MIINKFSSFTSESELYHFPFLNRSSLVHKFQTSRQKLINMSSEELKGTVKEK